MILGREPIRFLRQSVVLLALITPHICLGQNKSPPEDNTWTTPTQKRVSDAPAESHAGEGQSRPGEITDPWSAPSPEEVAPSAMPEPNAGEARWSNADNDELYDTAPRAEPPWERQPQSRVRAPNYSLWLGVGPGWTLPFGDLWGSCVGFDALGRCAVVNGIPSHDYVAQGPALELDLGARLNRHYNLYGLWEHSWLGAGSATNADHGQPEHGDTDFFALGLRVSTDPDDLGFVLDIAVGSRRMRAHWADGTELQMTDAPFETRLGIGADVRLSDTWSLTPLLSLGLGSFGKVEWVLPDRTVQNATQPGDVALTHGWVGLQMAAHADLLGTK